MKTTGFEEAAIAAKLEELKRTGDERGIVALERTLEIARNTAPTLLETLNAEHEKRQGARVALEADLDAARRRLAVAEGETLEADGPALGEALARRRAEVDLIEVLGQRIARAEAARVEAAERATTESKRLATIEAQAAVREHEERIAVATERVIRGHAALAEAIKERGAELEEAQRTNEAAAGYGVPPARGESTRTVLEALARKTGLRVDVVGSVTILRM